MIVPGFRFDTAREKGSNNFVHERLLAVENRVSRDLRNG
jgi:hypothetical protein